MKSKREEMLDVVSHMDVVLPLVMLFIYIYFLDNVDIVTLFLGKHLLLAS
jgi:hypothetical protein